MSEELLKRHTCDRCGDTQDQIRRPDDQYVKPKGWGTVSLEGGPVAHNVPSKDLCRRCASLLINFLAGQPLVSQDQLEEDPCE